MNEDVHQVITGSVQARKVIGQRKTQFGNRPLQVIAITRIQRLTKTIPRQRINMNVFIVDNIGVVVKMPLVVKRISVTDAHKSQKQHEMEKSPVGCRAHVKK